jgi:hypothetical protein
MPVKCWLEKTIQINDSWGPGAFNVLQVPLGVAPEFSLRGRFLRDKQNKKQVSHLRAEISCGHLSDGWQDAVFAPVGTVAVQGISGLPVWDPSQAAVYRDLIDGPNNNLGDSTTVRLEGVVPYVDASGSLGYDIVRLYYASNAVQGASADLVIVKIATLVAISGTVQIKQDGAAHGPPS